MVRVVRDNKRLKIIALRFYNERLKGNSLVLERCEDRHQFTQELYLWKDTERQKHNDVRDTSPSAIIGALKYLKKISVKDEEILIWTELPNLKKDGSKEKTPQQRVREAAMRIREKRGELEKNRNGISVDGITFGIENDGVARPHTSLQQMVAVSNRSSSHFTVKVKDEIATRRGLTVTGTKEFLLPSGRKYEFVVAYTPTNVGVANTILLLDFSCTSIEPGQLILSPPFTIARYISVRCGDPDDNAILKPTSKYERKKYNKTDEFQKAVHVKKEERNGQPRGKKFLFPLSDYKIPADIRTRISNETIEDYLTDILFMGKSLPDELPSDLSPLLSTANYSILFHNLLWIEEAQMQTDIKNYDMEGAKLERRGRYYSLLVPGLAESRPSVLRGDVIKVSHRTGSQCFAGVVEMIECEKAILQFPRSFDNIYVGGMGFNVRFSFSRTTLRTCHQALVKAESNRHPCLDFQIFPEFRHSLHPLNPVTRIIFKNKDLNVEQKSAVIGILESRARPLPYVIFGPPGTGKTVTMVEAIVQTLKANPASRILVCAPSNTATDLIVQRLAPFVSKNEMLRLLAFTRDRKTVPVDILDFTSYDESQNAFITPHVSVVKKMKVVAVTLGSGGKLPNDGISGHFTHAFMDEAGHAIEPLALSCFADTLSSSGEKPVLVLAGDPKQLGPIIRSELAKDFGLDKSMLERICGCDAYQRRDGASGSSQLYDSRLITKLVKNYRSHEAILKIPNERFYDGDLQCCADYFKINSLVHWEHLPTKGFPMIFDGVESIDEREGNSPSWFNREEAQKVKEYVGLLVNGTRQNKVQPEEIGVITPYHKQAQKIRMLLKSHDYGDVKVGSVDEFQGSERRVVIISTVRSSVEYMDFDARHQLGFLANEKRFNVAITRAQALLIVIGNPKILGHDKDWGAFVQYCFQNGGYTGVPYSGSQDAYEPDAGIESAINGLASMALDGGEDSDDDFVIISNTTAQEGPAWRMEE